MVDSLVDGGYLKGRVDDIGQREERCYKQGDPSRDGLHRDDERGPADSDKEAGWEVVVEDVRGRLAAELDLEAGVRVGGGCSSNEVVIRPPLPLLPNV